MLEFNSSQKVFVYSNCVWSSESLVAGKLLYMEQIVVVFDFDKTIIDCDSDNWVVNEMGVVEVFNDLYPSMPWNSLMDKMMTEIQSRGKSILEIAECLKRAPLLPWIITAIKSAHALACDLRILSDANHFFIETILKHHGLFDYFSEINTNPTFVDEDGALRILPYHDFSSPHSCNRCPPNLCKGLVIERIRSSISAEEKRFIYIGDGKGDFCPSLKLEKRDFVMPRKNFPLWDLICSNQLLLEAEIREWSNAEELEKVLLHLIDTTNTEEKSSNQSHSVEADCKLQAVPISSHETRPKALRVPH